MKQGKLKEIIERSVLRAPLWIGVVAEPESDADEDLFTCLYTVSVWMDALIY